jgi:hypothetical protein
MGFQMALDLHKALIHSGREQKAKIGGEKKAKTQQQQQQQ